MHGAGNDFVLFDARQQNLELDEDRVRAIADRRTGVGCDQVLVLHATEHDDAAAQVEIFNADGSRAEQCGNGMRCIARHLAECDGRSGPQRVITPAGPVDMEYLGDGQSSVTMGIPRFEPSSVPTTAQPGEDGWYRLDVGKDRPLRLGAVSMGNPHAVLVVTDLQAASVGELGPLVGAHDAFPEGCNVGFAEIHGADHVALRVFERGAGETRACGSGACAAVAWLSRQGLVGRRVRVQQAGGDLMIESSEADQPIRMTGPASRVFRGDLTWGMTN